MRGQSFRWGFLCVVLLMAVIIAGCGGGGSRGQGGGAQVEQGLQAGDNVLDPDTIAVGDIIGGLQVEEITEFRPGVKVTPNMRVTFSGRIEVTGDYHYHAAGITPGQVTFGNLDEASLERVPRVKGDLEYEGFTFENLEEAQEAFGPAGSKGTATIIIEQYVVERYPGTSKSDRAVLVEVISKEPQS